MIKCLYNHGYRTIEPSKDKTVITQSNKVVQC